jgi:uracil-DNA glycosylase
MQINKSLKCNLPCKDVNGDIIYPKVSINPITVKLVMISESPSSNLIEYYYKNETSSFFINTQAVFNEAGSPISSYKEIIDMGIYLTTAIKCSKKEYLVSSGTIKECTKILEYELDQFPNVRVVMCMGDFAIKAINYISKRKYGKNAISAGSIYKIRKMKHELNGITYLPSYTQTGDSFNIEKSKRMMIVEDIKNALSLINKCI